MSLTRGFWHLKVEFFFKSTSSGDSDKDERDPNDLFRMGLLDASSLEVSEGMGVDGGVVKGSKRCWMGSVTEGGGSSSRCC